MKVCYPLKLSDPASFATALVKYISDAYDLETSYLFQPILQKIQALRNKATSLTLKADTSDEDVNKMIEMLSVYTKYALTILKRFNWNPARGNQVQGVILTWADSFQPQLKYNRNTILMDVFCCYYNLAVMYFIRALQLSQVDLDGSRKQGMLKAKYAAYLLKQMKEKYYGEFVNIGFHDTQFAHLDMLYHLCLGIIYKCMYDTFKANQFKFGINKIAAIAALAHRNFYNAYNVGSTYFMQPSGISDKTKGELLSLAYIQSLYFDVQSNIKFAKYYMNLMEQQNQSHQISVVIAYQRKTQRLLNLGLQNQSVEQLLNMNKARKQELLNIQIEVNESLNKNQQRNQMIYKQPEMTEQQIPPPEEIPQELIVKLVTPPNLILDNEGEFSKLMCDESYELALMLSNFGASRKQALESSQKKLNEEIEKTFNESFVNYYLQLLGGSAGETKNVLPKSLSQKLLQIRKKGGKVKLEQDVKAIHENQKNVAESFAELKKQIMEEQAYDKEKRQQYGQNKWVRPPSTDINPEYKKKIESLESKFKIGAPIDNKILEKYNKNLKYIQILNQTDEQIAATLPKPQIAQFLQTNSEQLSKLKEMAEAIKVQRQKVLSTGMQINDKLQKINYAKYASEATGQNKPKEDIFKEVFAEVQALINQFNDQCRVVKEQSSIIATVAVDLNSKNKEQNTDKKQFEAVVNSFNEIYQLFGEMAQGMTFYTKLNDYLARLTAEIADFVYARKISAEELEARLSKGGGGGYSSGLPNMYPNQQPPSAPNNEANQNTNQNPGYSPAYNQNPGLNTGFNPNPNQYGYNPNPGFGNQPPPLPTGAPLDFSKVSLADMMNLMAQQMQGMNLGNSTSKNNSSDGW